MIGVDTETNEPYASLLQLKNRCILSRDAAFAGVDHVYSQSRTLSAQ